MQQKKTKIMVRAVPVLVLQHKCHRAWEVIWKQRDGALACYGAAGETTSRSEFQIRTKERRLVSHEKREVML